MDLHPKGNLMPEQRPREGSQKAVGAMAPTLSAAVIVIVNWITGSAGIGIVPPGHEVQMAIALLVLAALNYAGAWYMVNHKPEPPLPDLHEPMIPPSPEFEKPRHVMRATVDEPRVPGQPSKEDI